VNPGWRFDRLFNAAGFHQFRDLFFQEVSDMLSPHLIGADEKNMPAFIQGSSSRKVL
jgi:hypothetical protein